MKSIRVFLAFLLPSSIKDKIIEYQHKKIPQNLFRLISPENLHLTLLFLGYLPEKKILSLEEICKQIASNYSPFKIEFHKISPGPLKSSPRLIWLEGKPSFPLQQLRTKIEKKISQASIPYELEKREFHPHITLARLRKNIPRPYPPSIRNLEEKFYLSFTVSSFWLMESHLKPTGAEYKKRTQFSFSP